MIAPYIEGDRKAAFTFLFDTRTREAYTRMGRCGMLSERRPHMADMDKTTMTFTVEHRRKGRRVTRTRVTVEVSGRGPKAAEREALMLLQKIFRSTPVSPRQIEPKK